MPNNLKLSRRTYSKYEISAMDSIYKAIDKFESLGLTTNELYKALDKIEGRFECN